nr:hypothetical protein [Candidatus Sigynarchaeum springense]
MKGTVPFFCWGDDCIVPASVGGLVPGTPVMAMAVYRRGRWPAPVMEAIAGLARAYPEIAAGFVRALVTSPRTSQITWNAAIEVLETATGTLAVLPGMKELWSQGLDAIEKETASRKFRARVDVMQPLHAWIRREGVEYKP